MANDQLIYSEVTDEYTSSYIIFLMANMTAKFMGYMSHGTVRLMLLWDDAKANPIKHFLLRMSMSFVFSFHV